MVSPIVDDPRSVRSEAVWSADAAVQAAIAAQVAARAAGLTEPDSRLAMSGSDCASMLPVFEECRQLLVADVVSAAA